MISPADLPCDSDSDGDGIPLLLEYAVGLESADDHRWRSACALAGGWFPLGLLQQDQTATDITCVPKLPARLPDSGVCNGDVDQCLAGPSMATPRKTVTGARQDNRPPHDKTGSMRLKVAGPETR